MLVLIFTFALCYFLLLLLLLWGVLRESKPLPAAASPFISIIVAMKNEQEHIASCLDALVLQDYPADQMEIVLVDDNSTDNSLAIVKSYANKYGNVRWLQNNQKISWQSTKKSALYHAVKTARGEILLLTDADCLPPKSWARTMVASFHKEVGMVAGYSPQTTFQKSWWDDFIQMDSQSAAFVAASTIGYGRGVTCTGRNLAFRKQTIDELGGYRSLPDTLSGDDDFLLQHVSRSKKWRVRYCCNPKSHVPAQGPDNLKRFLTQKTRHLSAGKYFPRITQIGYATAHLANLIIWLGAFGLGWMHPPLISLLAVKCLIECSCLVSFQKKLGTVWSWKGFFLWQILFPYYHIVSASMARIQPLRWETPKSTEIAKT